MTILNMVWWWKSVKVPLNDISTLSVTAGDGEATITWTDVWDLTVNGVLLNTWNATKLVRKTGSAPSDSSDWTVVVTETVADTYSVNPYTDSWLTNWTTYYYKAFSVGSNWLESGSNSVSVVPANAWHPDPTRTIFYYDLEDSNDRLADSSWNNNDAIWTTAITYSQVWNEYVAETTWNPCGITIDGTLWSSIGSWDFAISFWTYFVNPAISDGYPMLFWMNDPSNKWPNIFFNPNNAYSMWQAVLWRMQWGSWQHPWSIDATTLLNGWHHLVMTRNSWTLTAYIDWVLDVTWSDSTSFPTTAGVQCLLSRPNDQWQSFWSWAKWDKFILENVAWSATDVTNYFNQTKWDYWIS